MYEPASPRLPVCPGPVSAEHSSHTHSLNFPTPGTTTGYSHISFGQQVSQRGPRTIVLGGTRRPLRARATSLHSWGGPSRHRTRKNRPGTRLYSGACVARPCGGEEGIERVGSTPGTSTCNASRESVHAERSSTGAGSLLNSGNLRRPCLLAPPGGYGKCERRRPNIPRGGARGHCQKRRTMVVATIK